jgi:hypothetical protein
MALSEQFRPSAEFLRRPELREFEKEVEIALLRGSVHEYTPLTSHRPNNDAGEGLSTRQTHIFQNRSGTNERPVLTNRGGQPRSVGAE